MLAERIDVGGVSLSQSELKAARARIVERLTSAAFVSDPFHHCEIDAILTDEVYAKLVEVMRAEQFVPVGTVATTFGYEKRHVLQFDTHLRSSESRQPRFWAAFTRDLLFHPEVMTAFISRCAPYTVFGSGQRFAALPHRATLHAIQDGGDYALPPHTDLCRKLGTMLIYLPDVSGGPGEGTVLYRPKDPAFTCRLGLTHHNPALFDACGTAAYEPNHAFVFARTDRSFHGVRKLPPGSRRHLLQLTVQRQNVSDLYPEMADRA